MGARNASLARNAFIVALAAGFLAHPRGVLARSFSLHVVTDRTTYNVGARVRARVAFTSPPFHSRQVQLFAQIRYAGPNAPIAPARVTLPPFTPSAGSSSTPYVTLWTVPINALTGRYKIELTVLDARTRTVLFKGDAGSFAVHRLWVRIEGIQLNRTFYTSGDSVSCRVTLKNLTHHPLKGLRVEFSNRYWPWIAGPAAQAAASVVTLETDLNLAPNQQFVLEKKRVAVAPTVIQPTFHQYGVVVWDHARQTVLAIAFSPLVIVRPPGVNVPIPYPPQYVFPELSDIASSIPRYRDFYPPGLARGAISFGKEHTMYPPGAEANLPLTVENPTQKPWRDVSIAASLLNANGHKIARKIIEPQANLEHGLPALQQTLRFRLPGAAGVYWVRVSIQDTLGNILATNKTSLAVNPLPKSILIFCAHEDDEGAWMGWIRAAVENRIPIHIVYLTSGDAGSCDMYYQRSCGPATALNFGYIRMAEARAALAHLGVPFNDVEFLGLPDGGSGEIWYHHTISENPFLDPLLACDHAPYAGLVEPNLAYARNPVLGVIRRIILKDHPAVVVTSHPPSQGHIDHIVTGYLVIRALQQLARRKELSPSRVQVLVDRVYNPKTVPYTPYHYATRIFYVSEQVMMLAQEAEWYYESQGSNHALARIRAERQLPREVSYRQVLDWMEHEGWNQQPPSAKAQ